MVAGPRVRQAHAALRPGLAWPDPVGSGLVTQPRCARTNASHRAVHGAMAELRLSPPCRRGARPTFHPTYRVESLDVCTYHRASVVDPGHCGDEMFPDLAR